MYRLLLLIPLLIFCACKKYENLEVTTPGAEYAVPIGFAELDWQDVIDNISDSTVIRIDDQGIVHLNYKGTVQKFEGSDIAEFVNQFNAPLIFLDTLVALPFSTPPGIDLDYAILSNGGARFGYQSNFNEPVNVKITLLNIETANGEPYSFTNNHPAGVVDFLSDSIFFDNHILRPTNDSIFVHYEYIRANSMDKVTPDFIGAVIFDFETSYMEGFLGQETFNVDRDTIDIDFFEETLTGDIFIEDPKVNVVITNSFGFPIRSSGSVFNFFEEDGSVLELESSALDLIDVDYPSLNEVGVKKVTEFPFDNDNSNLSDLILSRPIALEYEFIANANPDLDTSIRGFLLDTSVFEIQVAVDLPLKGWAKDFAADDTLSYDIDPVSEVESAELKIIVENELPLNIAVQGYFLNDQNNQVDSIFREPQLILYNDGISSGEPHVETIFLPLSEEKLNTIYTTKKMLVTAKFDTSGDTNNVVEMLATQKVNIKIGLKFKLKE